MRRKITSLRVILSVVLLAATFVTAIPFEPTQVAQAEENSLYFKLSVLSARTESNWRNPTTNAKTGININAPVAKYKWIINKNNTGNPLEARFPNCSPVDANGAANANYPQKCEWPSIHPTDAHSPIVAQGDQSTFTGNKSLSLPRGNYLISVWADGFKIDGAFFSLPNNAATETTPFAVVVKAQPYPLPLATVKLQVFEDINPVNGQHDVPGERGLAGFEGHLNDVLGIVSNDWYGNPICTVYQKDANGNITLDANDKPTVVTQGGKCLSDADGVLTIPNMGPNRYTASVVAPTGTNWVQTTTLEGNHDWDVWVSEGATGFDIEQIGPGGEPVPAIPFGYVRPTTSPIANVVAPTTGTPANGGSVTGVVMATKTYIPQQGGLPYTGSTNGVGALGGKLDKPIDRPWIALNDLQRGDTPVYVGRGGKDGKFTINNVPDGDYALAYWDDAQDYLLDFINVTVSNGQMTDTGTLTMSGWWTVYTGRVCQDDNGNGKCDPGERGIPNQTIQLLSRANSALERGIASVTTDANGYYNLRESYPLTSWYVMQVYNDNFKTVGVTYQADNQANETTVMGSMVDVSVFPVIGLSGRLDWALKRYDYNKDENGGIVGTVYYDTTRNELDAAYALAESYQPGIPGIDVDLYAPIPCTPKTVKCDGNGLYELNTDGSYKFNPGQRLNRYTTESWNRPTGCVPRDVSGKFIQQSVTPRRTDGVTDPDTGNLDTSKDCLEAPFMGIQFDPNASQVNGNYGFATTKRDPKTGKLYASEQPLPPGDYIVKVNIPKDSFNKPVYQVTKEEDVNVFTGDQFTPQVPPQPCAGALHKVHVDPAVNPGFANAGGSIYEGQDKPLCDSRLVTVQVGKSVAPSFFLFTPVPIPGKMWGLINDDLNLSTDPKEIMFGEKRGLANVPIGVYDFTNRLITTVISDPNGFYELLLPSTSTYNCPLPAGPCPNVYRLVGNDPGQPGNLNAYYNPQYKTISASFEVWPGLVMPADHAPIPISSAIATPGSQQSQIVQCKLDATTPQIFQIERPYTRVTDSAGVRQITIQGDGFGASRGTGKVTLGTTTLAVNNWNNHTIVVTIPDTITPGPYQLNITASNGQTTPSGITFHVLADATAKGGYNPTIFEVGVGKTFNPRNYVFPYDTTANKGPIQAALDAAAAVPAAKGALVVVYPGDDNIPVNKHGASIFNANGAYFENVVINSAVKLQGVGPGGIRANGSTVKGSVIDGQGFGAETYGDAWRTYVSSKQWAGNQTLYEGAVVTVLPPNQNAFNANFKTSIDGFHITGGDQMGVNTKNNSIPGGVVLTQGGGIYVNSYAKFLQITNNLVRSNGGAYGGGIRLGTPFYPAPNSTVGSVNTDVRIGYNRIVSNGGTNLAGGIGIFPGSDRYEIDHNDICGNYSGEYGGGIGQYGFSPDGKIHDNRIYFNTSFDEGGGIKIGGEVPPNPNTPSAGTGPVDIYNNLIQANLGNDDGGGIRLLMVQNYQVNIFNNIIANNISTHEGGGISLDDAPKTAIFNNTIVKNITTATAATSNGQPAPAGISTALNSVGLPGKPFSDPLLFNNILWDNRAGHWDGTHLILSGIGLTGDTNPINYWDMGTADGSGSLSPTNSIYQSSNGVNASPTNKVGVDPAFVDSSYNVSVSVFPWRTQPTFAGATIVAIELPPNLMGNYHIKTTSPAVDSAAASKTYNGITINIADPKFKFDYNNQARPKGAGFDIGADEVK